MKILLIAATPGETELIRRAAHLQAGHETGRHAGGHTFSIVHTGIGMVNTAYYLGHYLRYYAPQLAIQLGVAGAFPEGPEIGEVVEIVEESYSELGAESPEGFLDLEAMGFPNFEHHGRTWYNSIQNPRPSNHALRKCRGITVNTVHGTAAGIAQVQELWHPEVETMEGAAFFQACILGNLPFFAFRGISNRVEPRNRAHWKLKEAAENVQRFILREYFQIEA